MDLHLTPGAALLSTTDLTIPHQTDAVAPDVADTPSTTPKSLTADRVEPLLQIQKMDPICKHISNDCQTEKPQSMRPISSYM